MGIEKGPDGSLTFDIPVNLECSNITLPKFSEYLNFLNEPELAQCIINRLGMVTDTDINGSFVQSKPDTFRVIPGFEFNPVIYRGQNNDYPFMPSSKRYELFDGNERVRHSIEWIKKNEFINMLSASPYIKRAKNFRVLDFKYDIDMEAISKHYELVSDYLDVTRDVMTALFFAYTYYDKDENKILPLPAFEYNTPYIYVGNIKELYEKFPISVENIGLQLMPRSMAQNTLSINVSENYDYIKGLFKKIELPKNPAIAKYIYNKFDGGKLLTPDDYASKLALERKGRKTLQQDLFEEYCEDTKTDEEWLKDEYKKRGYILVNIPSVIQESARSIINKEIDDIILPYLDNGIIFRGIKQ